MTRSIQVVIFLILGAILVSAQNVQPLYPSKDVSGWWILVRIMSGPSDGFNIPRAIGPYPSQEMCRIAGREMMPVDRRFWTLTEREKAEVRDKVEAEKARLASEKEETEIKQIAESVCSGKRKPGDVKLPSGTFVTFDKDGKETGRSWGIITYTTSFMGASSSVYDALTSCVEIKGAQQ